mmetsp:Transcript_10654/g.34073  ORF Transcript_10654/g.34073 Transcript_10654/m.34073 type:complete len:126 (-) Transcript_10654:57-434(-)
MACLFGETTTLWWVANLTCFTSTATNYPSVHSTAYTVLHFHVHFWNSVYFVCRCIANISHGTVVNNISYLESLDSLILWWFASTSVANYLSTYMTATLAVSAMISSLNSHFYYKQIVETFLQRII